MVRCAILLVLLSLVPVLSVAQSREVDPDDLKLELILEELPATPYRQEMILLTIHGLYKRHITREKLIQPDLEGFNWMQLGEDYWYESMIDGLPVKNMRRRMALFPDASGKLEIAAFRHQLTLLDEENKWFEHTISSTPLTLEVAPEPAQPGWWFPVRGLTVSDDWSNPPDQLNPGEGVLRVIRISALGASPDMLPPMPQMNSPSALIFAHPEKRLVDLTPMGPRAIAFWRWTVTPTNGRSAILEPIRFSYFDTVSREDREVEISVQRVAFDEAVSGPSARPVPVAAPARLRPAALWGAGALGFAVAFLLGMQGRGLSIAPLRDWVHHRRLLGQLRQAARRGDEPRMRRAARALNRRAPADAARAQLITQLDSRLFGPRNEGGTPADWDARGWVRAFEQHLTPPPRSTRTRPQTV